MYGLSTDSNFRRGAPAQAAVKHGGQRPACPPADRGREPAPAHLRRWCFPLVPPLLGPPKSQRLFGERRSCGMIELSRLRESERYPAHSDEVTAHPPPGSPRQPKSSRRICAEKENLSLYTKATLEQKTKQGAESFFRKFSAWFPGPGQWRFAPHGSSRLRPARSPQRKGQAGSGRRSAAPGTEADG